MPDDCQYVTEIHVLLKLLNSTQKSKLSYIYNSENVCFLGVFAGKTTFIGSVYLILCEVYDGLVGCLSNTTDCKKSRQWFSLQQQTGTVLGCLLFPQLVFVSRLSSP